MTNIIIMKLIPLFGRLWTRKLSGAENIPKEKIGFIIACNHSSYMDHFISGGTIIEKSKRMVYYLAKKEHFQGNQKGWHKFLQAIPIDRQAGGKSGLKMAIKALKKGKIIAIYPEGTRTLTGKLNRAKTGIARLALTAKVPVLPIGLTNTFKILPKGKMFPKFKRTEVNIGKLMYFDKYYGQENNKNVLRSIADDIMKTIAKLSKKQYNF